MSQKELINNLEIEIARLKSELLAKEQHLKVLKEQEDGKIPLNPFCDALSQDEIVRYSRQMIMPDVQVKGQLTLKNSKVLIVGAGGLGCPAALYLAAAGVGKIAIMDSDTIELTNLHRQILHYEYNIGDPKVISAKETLNSINKNVQIQAIHTHLTEENIEDNLKFFDVVIDGTDNVATRYLLNDACVMQNKPLVSGSALQWEGQLTLYHYKGGPCYRCLFPKPPPPETVTSCGDGGVLGAVPGCIGVLQALETIKILLNMSDVLSEKMLIFDGSNTTFRNIKLRKKNPNCAVCGENPSITAPINYEQFCRANAHDKGENISLLTKDDRISVKDYEEIMKSKHLLIDTRSEAEFQMCRLPSSVNIPFTNIQADKYKEKLNELFSKEGVDNNDTVYVVCRRGNDSQRAVKILNEEFPNKFKDIVGGLHEFSKKVDKRFPVY